MERVILSFSVLDETAATLRRLRSELCLSYEEDALTLGSRLDLAYEQLRCESLRVGRESIVAFGWAFNEIVEGAPSPLSFVSRNKGLVCVPTYRGDEETSRWAQEGVFSLSTLEKDLRRMAEELRIPMNGEELADETIDLIEVGAPLHRSEEAEVLAPEGDEYGVWNKFEHFRPNWLVLFEHWRVATDNGLPVLVV